MPDIEERLEALEAEVATLSAREQLLTDFLMATICLLPNQVGQTLRKSLVQQIAIANRSVQLDASAELHNILRALDTVFTPGD